MAIEKLRHLTAALAMLALTGCVTTDGTHLTVADLQIGDQTFVIEPVPDLEDTELPYAPVDDQIEKANAHFARGEYGHAERFYREATIQRPDAVDAWLGLAASYDQLRRFDLATKAYNSAIKLVGPSATILNNMGYSYLLRGNLKEARKKLLAAYELEPDNPHVRANLELLREGVVRAHERSTS